MKSLLLIGFIAISVLSCKKEAENRNICSFFPFYKGENITYSSAAIGNISPGQNPYVRDVKGIATDSVLFIGEYGFILRNCEDESIWVRFNGSAFPIVENSKSDGVIFANSKYKVIQQKSNIKITATVTDVSNQDRVLIVDFIPGKGVKGFTSYLGGKASREYYLKE